MGQLTIALPVYKKVTFLYMCAILTSEGKKRVKTPVSLILAVLLVAAIVSAANVTLTPTTIYETTSAWETIDINNYKGSSVIDEVEVETTTLPITAAESYTGWTKVQDSDSALWKDGSIETNVKSAVFEFKVTAPNVTASTNETVTISLDSSSTAYTITILNDASPPAITNIKPDDYAKANNPSQSISATIIDAETSVTSATYTWNDCGNGTDTTITLTKSGDTYASTADFSGYDEGEKACYTFTATNAPGETATETGELLFDGTAPDVTLTAPTAFATESTTFKFTATDNIAAVLSCVLKLDSTELGTYNATNGTEKSTTLDLSSFSEGSYTASVTCADGVGLTDTHALAIILDTAPPVITLAYNPFILRTQTDTFTATVTDTIGLASVNATFDGEDVALTQSGDDYDGDISSDTLGTKTLEITATDDVGHTTTETKTITVVPNHQLTLALSPSTTTEDATVTASGDLTTDGNVTENDVTVNTPSGDFTIELDENNEYSISFSAPSPGTYTVTTEYTEDGYTYTADATLTVSNPTSSQSSRRDGSNGYDSSWSGAASYVKPDEPPADTSSNDNNAVIPDQPAEQPSTPPPTDYVPLPPEPPRDALTPKGTGIFDLGKNIKWLALLIALALIVGMGIYAYKKRPKDDSGIDWNGYFKGDGA